MFRPTFMAGLLLAHHAALAAGEPPPPVCGQPDVLRLVAERLGHAGGAVFIEAGSIGQLSGPGVPGTAPQVVHCAVRVRTALYDTGRLGPQPVFAVTVYQYTLELRANGAFMLP